MSYRKRVDAKQGEIVSAFRRLGWYVHDTSRFGGGFPDVVCARGGQLILVEVKDGSKPLSQQALTPAEAKAYLAFAAAGVTIHLVRSVEDVLRLSRFISFAFAHQWCERGAR